MIRNIFKKIRKTANLSFRLKSYQLEKNKELMNKAWNTCKYETNYVVKNKLGIDVCKSKQDNLIKNTLFNWFKYSSKNAINKIKTLKYFKEKDLHTCKFYFSRLSRKTFKKVHLANAYTKIKKMKLFTYLNNPMTKIIKKYWNKQLRGKYLSRLSQIYNRYIKFKPFYYLYNNMDTQIKHENLLKLAKSYHETKVKKNIYHCLYIFQHKNEHYSKLTSKITKIKNYNMATLVFNKFNLSLYRLNLIEQKVTSIYNRKILKNAFRSAMYRFWFAVPIKRRVQIIQRVKKNIWYIELKKQLLYKLIDRKRIIMLNTLVNSGIKNRLFKEMKQITERGVSKKNAAYAIFANVEMYWQNYKIKEFMSKFRENSSLLENKILETKMVNQNTKLVNAFSNFSKKCLKSVFSKKKFEYLSKNKDSNLKDYMYKQWKFLYYLKIMQKKTDQIVISNILKRSIDKLKYAYACENIIKYANKKNNIKMALKSFTGLQNNVISNHNYELKHKALVDISENRLKQQVIINWKIITLDLRKNRKTDLFRKVNIKNKVFNALLKKYRVKKFKKSIIEYKEFNQLKKNFNFMYNLFKYKFDKRVKINNMIKIAAKCVKLKYGKIFYMSLKYYTKHTKIQDMVAGKFLKIMYHKFSVANHELAQKTSELSKILNKFNKIKKFVALKNLKHFSLIRQRQNNKLTYSIRSHKRQKLKQFFDSVTTYSFYKQSFSKLIKLAKQFQIYSTIRYLGSIVKYRKLKILAHQFYKVRLNSLSFQSLKNYKEYKTKMVQLQSAIRHRMIQTISKPTVDLIYDFFFKWHITNYELQHQTFHNLKKYFNEQKKKRVFYDKVETYLNALKRRNVFYYMVDTYNINNEIDIMSKKAQVILLKNSGKTFLERSNEIVKKKNVTVEITERLLNIKQFRSKKYAFDIIKKNKENTFKQYNLNKASHNVTKSFISKQFGSFKDIVDQKKSYDRLKYTMKEHANISSNRSILRECFRRLKMNSENKIDKNKDFLRKYLRSWVEKLRSKIIYKNYMKNYDDADDSVTQSRMIRYVNDSVYSDYDLMKDL